MSLSSTVNRLSYVGDGSTNNFSFTFKIFAKLDLAVHVVDSSGTETDLTLDTDFSVPDADVGDADGGSITLIDLNQAWLDSDGNLDTGYTLVIRRVRPLTQETDVRNQGAGFRSSLEDAYDHLVMICQQLSEQIGRCIKFPKSETGGTNLDLEDSTTRASKFLAFDGSGDPISSSGGISGTVTVSAFGETLVDDADAATARTTLGVESQSNIIELISYIEPTLTYIDADTVDISNNVAASNATKILFGDGTFRTVSENTSSAHKFRRLKLSATAEFTSGTEDSGIQDTLSEAANTKYAVYAVKSQIDSTKFVLVATTTKPSNTSTLNTDFGTDGWVYIATIQNGGGGQNTATTDIVPFIHIGNEIQLRGASSSGNGLGFGLVVANASDNPAVYTYAEGMGSGQIPDHFDLVNIYATIAGGSAGLAAIRAANGTRISHEISGANGVSATEGWRANIQVHFDGTEVDRLNLQTPSSTLSKSIILMGWKDAFKPGYFAH